MKTIEVFNLGGLPTAPLDAFNELQEDFKLSDSDKLSKLQMLIITRGFKYSFKVWKDPEGKLWIIDAHQRKKALMALRKAGFLIPEIPYEEIHAVDKREAVEEIAAYNSEFAQKNPDTVLFEKYKIEGDTLDRFNLGYEVKKHDFRIGSEKIFATEYESDEIKENEELFGTEQEEEQIFAKPGDLFLLGENRLLCGDCRSKKDVVTLMNGRFADMILTDPPYNVAYEGGTDEKMKIEIIQFVISLTCFFLILRNYFILHLFYYYIPSHYILFKLFVVLYIFFIHSAEHIICLTYFRLVFFNLYIDLRYFFVHSFIFFK